MRVCVAYIIYMSAAAINAGVHVSVKAEVCNSKVLESTGFHINFNYTQHTA